MNLIPRNDYVLIRKKTLGETPSGIAVADHSVEGVQYFVEAIGHKVEKLEIGDRVLMVGVFGQDIAYLPNSRELALTKEANVVLIYGEDE